MPPRQKTGGRTKANLYIGGAILVAAFVALAVLQIVKTYKEQIEAANKPPPTISVVVAKRNLYTGIQVTADDVMVRQVLPEIVPQDADGVQVFRSLEEVLGRTPRERILANEIIRGERLARRNAGEGLNAIITPGKRAMTVETDEASGLAGLLQPGNYVDVIVTLRPDDVTGKASYATETLLQGIQVLAVGSNLAPPEAQAQTGNGGKATKENNRRSRSSATLELTLEEAEKLALAASRGDLHLVLRSDVDISPVETNGAIVINDMLGINGEEPTPETRRIVRKATGPTPPASTVEVIQGSDRSQTDFDAQGNQIEGSGKRR